MAQANERELQEVLNSPVLVYGMLEGSDHRVIPIEVNSDGHLTVVSAPDMDPQDPVAVNVAAVEAAIIPANPNRKALVMTNDSDTVMYIAVGKPAVANATTRLNASGGVYTLSRWGTVFSTAAIHAVHGGAGNKVLTYQEFI